MGGYGLPPPRFQREQMLAPPQLPPPAWQSKAPLPRRLAESACAHTPTPHAAQTQHAHHGATRAHLLALQKCPTPCLAFTG